MKYTEDFYMFGCVGMKFSVFEGLMYSIYSFIRKNYFIAIPMEKYEP